MAGALGSLVVSLGLDAAEFVGGLTKAQYEAKKFADNIGAGVTRAVSGFTAIAGTAALAVAAMARAADSVAIYKDLSEEIGSTGEAVASLQLAADVSGTALEQVAAASVKLTAQLSKMDDESRGAGAALRALNLPIDEFKKLDAVSQIESVSKALGGFKDGSEKTAIAVALFGKSGAQLLRFLKELEQQGGRKTILSDEQIEAADKFSDSIAQLKSELQTLAKVAFTEILPPFQALAEEFKNTESSLNIFRVAASGVRTAFETLAIVGANIIFVFKGVGREIAAIAAQTAALATLDLDGFKSISEAVKEDGIRARKELDEFEKRVLGIGQSQIINLKPKQEKLDISGLADQSGEQKKVLDGRIKAIREFAEQQRDAFEFAQRYVDGVNGQSLISLRAFSEAQASIRAASLSATVAALDKEIAALQSFKSKATKNEERIDAENKIAEAVNKRAGVIQKAGQENILATQKEQTALINLQSQYESFRSTLLDLSGDVAGASQLRIDQQVKQAQDVFTALGKDQSDIERFREILTLTEKLKKSQNDYNLLLGRASDQEELILLKAQERGQSEIATLQEIGAARQRTLVDLQAQVEAARELALALNSPDAIRFAEQLGLAFEKARAQVDPLLIKIRDVGKEAGDSIASGFENAIVEGVNLRDVLSGIERDLIRIITRKAITEPLGDFFGNLIGGNGQSSGGGGLIGSLFGSFLSQDLVGVFDKGTDYVPRSGLAMVHRGEQIIPASKNGSVSTKSITINQSFAPGTNYQTITQARASMARELAVANQRLN